MATVNSVSVLTPNGRRQTVKVTPNSTILQILEEVCTKQELDPLEYDLRHHSKILDTTMTVQFSRLPNNAQLEMVKAKKIRKESDVLVNIQIESGNRISGTFLPSESLWDVVMKLCPDMCVANKRPAVLYMRQEICGMEGLKVTTLRSLGLTSGRALLRFMCKPVEVPEQPDVTSKLGNIPTSIHNQTKGTVSGDSHKADKTQRTVYKEQDLKEKTQKEYIDMKASGPSSVHKEQDLKEKVQEASGPSSVGKEEHSLVKGKEPLAGQSGNKDISHQGPDKSNTNQHSPIEGEASVSKKQRTEIKPVHVGVKKKEIAIAAQEESKETLEDIFKAEIEPRDRNPVIFKPGSRRPSVSEDLPDEFFELTLDDVQNLYRELRNKHTEMNEAPLQTSGIRKLEESKRILNHLHKYKRAVLRIQFPDQIILQGSFSPVETIASVQEFVKDYLQDKSISFYLYTTPPKVILTPSARLIEVDCVPCALVHFGVPDGIQENIHYLREEVLGELSSPEAALAAVSVSRGILPTSTEKRSVPSTSGMQQIGASTSGVQPPKENKESVPSSSKADSNHAGSPNGKVPKWFKVGPK